MIRELGKDDDPSVSSPLSNVQSNRHLLAYVALASAITLIPLVLAGYPALVDFPNHLARHYIGEAIDSSDALQRYYVYKWRLVPNMAGDIIYLLLNQALPPVLCERLLVGVAIALGVIAPFVLNRAIWGKWSAGPSLAALTVYNASLRAGLENFMISSGASLLCFALWITWTNRLNSWRRAVLVLPITAVYFGHILGFVILSLLIGVYEVQRAFSSGEQLQKKIRTLSLNFLPFVPALMLVLSSKVTTRTAGPFQTIYGGLESRIYALISPFLMYDIADDLPICLFFLGIVGFFAVSYRARAIHPSTYFVVFVLFIASLAVPAVVQDIRIIHVRLPAILASVLVASADWRLLSRLQMRWFTAVVFVVLSLRAGYIADYWLEHDKEVAELRGALQGVEPGSKVLTTVNPKADTGPFHWFTVSYTVLDRQIFTPSLYPDVHMLSVTPPFSRLSPLVAEPVPLDRLPSPSNEPAEKPAQSSEFFSTWWRDFTILVVLSRAPVSVPYQDHLELVVEGSFFRIYKIHG